MKLNQQLQNEQDSQTTDSTETNDNTITVTLIAISEQTEEESEPPVKKMKTFFSGLISESDSTTADTSEDLNTIVEEYYFQSAYHKKKIHLCFKKLIKQNFHL